MVEMRKLAKREAYKRGRERVERLIESRKPISKPRASKIVMLWLNSRKEDSNREFQETGRKGVNWEVKCVSER
jgi:hypothetical protein